MGASTGKLTVMPVPSDVKNDSESIEQWLTEESWQVSNLDWMILSSIDIQVNTNN